MSPFKCGLTANVSGSLIRIVRNDHETDTVRTTWINPNFFGHASGSCPQAHTLALAT